MIGKKEDLKIESRFMDTTQMPIPDSWNSETKTTLTLEKLQTQMQQAQTIIEQNQKRKFKKVKQRQRTLELELNNERRRVDRLETEIENLKKITHEGFQQTNCRIEESNAIVAASIEVQTEINKQYKIASRNLKNDVYRLNSATKQTFEKLVKEESKTRQNEIAGMKKTTDDLGRRVSVLEKNMELVNEQHEEFKQSMRNIWDKLVEHATYSQQISECMKSVHVVNEAVKDLKTTSETNRIKFNADIHMLRNIAEQAKTLAQKSTITAEDAIFFAGGAAALTGPSGLSFVTCHAPSGNVYKSQWWVKKSYQF